MRIAAVEVENFRSIKSLRCEFDPVTTLVGPNGGGKSTVLRALDWFFNSPKDSLTELDLHKGKQGDPVVRVRVDFDCLTPRDRELLGSRYCRDDDSTWTAWRTWSAGDDKVTGKAFAFPEFEGIRSKPSAAEKREIYGRLRSDHPAYGLPAWTSVAQAEVAMDAWERAHPGELEEAEVSATHLHGFNAIGTLAQLLDFVFVSADLRAPAETEDAKASIFGRILQRALDRAAMDQGYEALNSKFQSDYGALVTQHLDPQLATVAEELSAEVQAFTSGRTVSLESATSVTKQPSSRIEVQISDGHISTPIAYQGHGFQRTLLVAALRVLARHGRKSEDTSHMFLAIEEPELFQHPTQAKALASVLRSLAADSSQSVQVAYATHSPYFVEPQSFAQVRRVTLAMQTGDACASSRISTASFQAIAADLGGFVKLGSVQRRWEQVCLKYLPEALFAESVILVEGDEDAAILEALGNTNALAVGGICVASVQGKSNMLIPFAILKRLGIRTLMVVDNDRNKAGRMKADGKSDEDVAKAVAAVKIENRTLCRFVGGHEEDYPVDACTSELFFMPDMLESVLAADLPEWVEKRKQIVKEGRGVAGKNAATYALAVRECGAAPAGSIHGIFGLMRAAA